MFFLTVPIAFIVVINLVRIVRINNESSIKLTQQSAAYKAYSRR